MHLFVPGEEKRQQYYTIIMGIKSEESANIFEQMMWHKDEMQQSALKIFHFPFGLK
jgi:hypothetical protein